MILRVRSRDGLERVSVPDSGTVQSLLSSVRAQLKLNSGEPIVLSRDQKLLLAKDELVGSFQEFTDPAMSLSALGLRHGDVLFLWCSRERQVEGPKVPLIPAGSFGKKMTVEDLRARQIRIERQEQAHCELLSFDRNAANEFQLYVRDTLGFSVQRGGFMYGSCNEQGEVHVEFIYEPPQTGSEASLLLHRNEAEERCVEAIASGLGLRRVGFLFTQTAAQAGDQDRNYVLSSAEIQLAAELHAEALGLLRGRGDKGQDSPMVEGDAAGGREDGSGAEKEGFKQFCIGVVKIETGEEGEPVANFEAYQLSDQCVKLFAEGLFEDLEDGKEGEGSKSSGVSKMKKEVIVMRKDMYEVDNDLFLVNVKIGDHEGALTASFPIENRLVVASEQDLHKHMEKSRSVKPFSQRLADFHLLLFLSHILDPMADLPVLAEAVRVGGPVPEGYQLILESI